MRMVQYVPAFVFLTLIISCSGIVSRGTSEHRDWSFVKSVGGIRIETPVINSDGRFELPVKCDVSGLTQYSEKPTMINSALVLKELKWNVIGNEIQIYIITCLVNENNKDSKREDLKIGPLTDGKYKIKYLNPDGSTIEVEEIDITRK